MIARIWRGTVSSLKAGGYLERMQTIALPEYLATEGNRGAYCFHQEKESVTHVVMVTLWEDVEAIKRFAGEDFSLAKYYDFDPEYLLEMEARVQHYDVLAGSSLHPH
jgi:heme-degrading monooxygenase HmoA